MKKHTDFNEVKEVAKLLLHTEPKADERIPIIVHHPFFNCSFMPDETGEFVNILKQDSFSKAAAVVEDLIDRSKTIFNVYCLLQAPYKLTFIKFIKPHLSREDFSTLLADAWVSSENPNCDVNVKIPTLISWFKQADKLVLMSQEDYDKYMELPSTFRIYRGVALGRNPNGLSWTQDYKLASWFAHRFDYDGRTGYVQYAEASKQNVLAYFNSRGEDEIVIDSRKLNIMKEV